MLRLNKQYSISRNTYNLSLCVFNYAPDGVSLTHGMSSGLIIRSVVNNERVVKSKALICMLVNLSLLV